MPEQQVEVPEANALIKPSIPATPPNEGNKETSIGIARHVKNVAEAFTVVALASYAIGFIVVNSYLLSYGYVGSSLFKTTYISAGLLFLVCCLPFALQIYSLVALHKQLKYHGQSDPYHWRRATIAGVTFISIISYLILNTIGTAQIRPDEELTTRSWVPWVVAGGLLISGVLAYLEKTKNEWAVANFAKRYSGFHLLLLYFMVCLFSIKASVVIYFVFVSLILRFIIFEADDSFIPVKMVNWPPSTASSLALIIVMLLSLMSLFGTIVYGNIKPQYGGGHPTRVRVMVSGEKLNQLRLGIGQNIASMLSDTLLLDSGDNKLLLLLKSSYDDKGLAVQIDRSIVDAIVYLPQDP